MSHYVMKLDDSRWPLLLATYEGDLPVEQYRQHLEETVSIADRHGSPFVFIVDSRVTAFGPKLRQASVEHMKKHEPFLKRRMLATALVTRSALQRGFMTAITWLYTPPYPFRSFATVEEASDWAREMLRAR